MDNALSKRLQDIRLLKRLTVEELAQQLGVTKQTISKYENNKMTPTAENLAKIIDFFQLPQGYLKKPYLQPEQCSNIFYRKSARTPQKEIDEVEVCFKWYYELIHAVGEYSNIHKINFPNFPHNISIEEKAWLLREHWGLGEEPIVDMAALLEKNGFYLFSAKMRNDRMDGYSQCIGDIAILVLNSNRGNRERQQFSLAHELGHMALHVNQEQLDYEKIEEEANQFAGCFLMPETALRGQVIRTDVNSILETAKQWHVSPDAVIRRFRMLSMLGRNEVENVAKERYLYSVVKSKKVLQLNDRILCTVKDPMEKIRQDFSVWKAFLRKLCLPLKEVADICSLPEDFFLIDDSPGLESVDDLDGVQLSFNFI